MGEDVDFSNLSDQQLKEYDSYLCNETEADLHSSEVLSILHWSKDMILNDQKSLLVRKHQMTASQKAVFDSLISYEGNQLLAFVTGPGGCGKSFLLHTLVLQYEFNCAIVEVLATSGNAALLVNGRTVHSFFKLDCNLDTSIQYRDTNWESICCTNVIIIDEISMMTAEILEKFNQICNETSTMINEKQLFGGKTVILFGDLLQLPAVTNNTSQSRQIYESQLWSKFYPFFLHENCRQSQDTIYAALLNRVRFGTHTTKDLELLQTRVCGSGHDLDHECQDMTSSNSMAICSKHVERMALNEQMQNSLLPTSSLHHLNATDYDAGGELLNKTESQQLNLLKSVMPQTISVKEGAKVMITRNLNVQSKIVNGTVGILKTVNKQVLMIQRLASDELIPVTKVKQKLLLPVVNTPVYRVQFPIIVAYACTVHRMQGATLKNAYISLDSSFFAAGQAYVALSRVQTLQGLHLLKFSSEAFHTNEQVCKMLQYAEKHNQLIPTTINQNRKQQCSADTTSQEQNIMPVCITSASSKSLQQITSLNQYNLQILSHHSCKLLKKIPLIHQGLQNMKILMLQNQQLLTHTAEQLISMMGIAVPDSIEDNNVSKECHTSFLSEYIPVHTQSRGNCLWQMISIGLCNKTVLMKTLRVLTAYALLEHQIHFEQLLAADRSISKPVLDEFEDLIKTSLTDKAWSNEYHLYALSIILQRPIYIYSTLKKMTFSDTKRSMLLV